MEFFSYLRNNRIKLLKYLITLVVFFFLLCVIFEIFKVLFDDVYNTITLTYILLIIIINFIPEFSPYILNNYLIYIFPFLSKYSGRGAVYICIGLATISPELNHILNFGGYALIGTGLLCLYMNWLLSKNINNINQEYIFNKEKKEDLNDMNDINYEKNNNSGRDSTNSDNNNNIDLNEKNDFVENNMLKLQEAFSNQKNEEENENIKKIEMKDLNN